MWTKANDGSFQPNFVVLTDTDIVRREPIAMKGNQHNGFFFIQFSNGSGGLEKQMKDWIGNKTGSLYRAEILAAQEFLAARVGEVMNAPIRDCRFSGTDARCVLMPYIAGKTGAEINGEIPDNPQGTALALFDYLVANADRRPKNVIFTPDNRIVGIDHALCNFRPRTPKPELVALLWNGGIDIDFLAALRPKFEALGTMFTSVAMADKHQNLLANLDRLVDALRQVEAVAVIKGDVVGHEFHGNQWTKVGPNGLPISTVKPKSKAPTKADWENLSKLWEGYRVETRYGDKEWDAGLGIKPGPSYSKRLSPELIDGMLKSLGVDKLSVDEDGNGVDAHEIVENWAMKNGVKMDEFGTPDFTEAQQEKADTIVERFDALKFAMRLSAIKDKDWPMGQPPAYPYDRPWRSLTTPLDSHESQLAREVLANTLADSIPSARTSMEGLEGVLETGGFVSGTELGKTGLSIVSNQSAYFDKRIRFEDKLFGTITDGEGERVSPIIGYMSPKDEFLDPSKPEDVERLVELRTTKSDGYGNIDTNRSAKDAADLLKNPNDFCVVYEKTWLPASGGKPGQWDVQQTVMRVATAMDAERDDPSPDSAGRDRHTVRYYPLANPDGSLNTNVLFGTRSNTEDISRYGEVSVQFKSPTLKDATITPGDSADNQRDPLPAALAAKADPRLSMFDWGKRLSTGEIGIVQPEYIEAQFWKAPKVSDIAKVVFTGAPPSPRVVKMLNENKIPYNAIGAARDTGSYALKPSQFRKIYGKG